MPIYEYQCEQCEHTFEEWQKDFSERDVPCPECGGQSQRLISNTAFILKGSGWYVTDYARGNGSNGSNGSNGKAKDDAKSAEAKPADAKGDSGAKADTGAKSTDAASSKAASSSSAPSGS